MAENGKKRKLYVGVDVGGTKILAALVRPNGRIVARERRSTPRGRKCKLVIDAIVEVIHRLLADANLRAKDISALGLAVPGVVDATSGRIVAAPNVALGGVAIVDEIVAAVGVPTALGNDVNLGTLGEKWLGSARGAGSVVGVFLGTGIGGGVFADGKLFCGAHGTAAEIGHMIMQLDGPKCGCGLRGCFEALASRTAIERDIRAAIKGGRKSVVTELLGGKDDRIRSGVLKEAIAAGDRVVTDVLTRASEVTGLACVALRNLYDPEVIVLGGGVIEACWDFMLPIVERAVAADPFAQARPGARVLQAALGDDAVVLGAAALAQQHTGADPFGATPAPPDYPRIETVGGGRVAIAGKTYETDVYVRADGKVRQFKKGEGSPGEAIKAKVLGKVCARGPETLFVGSPKDDSPLNSKGELLVRSLGIELRMATTGRAAKQFEKFQGRKAILLRLGGT